MEKKALTEKLKTAEHDLRTPLNAIMGYTEIVQEKLTKAGLKEYDDYLTKILDSSKKLLTLINDIFDAPQPNVEQNKTQALGKKVLIIGCDIRTYPDIERAVQKAGFTVLQGKSGSEGLKLARLHKPDVIAISMLSIAAMDDTLIDEWITLSELKSDPELSEIPVVVMSNDSPESLGFRLNDVDFMTKPVDVKLLVNKVKHLVPEGTLSAFLIVEDDDAAREILCEAITKVGCKAIEAKNGLEALDKLKESTPSIVLLDLMMPEMDGFEVINEMQKNDKWRNIPVIIVSAKSLSAKERAILSKYSKAIFQKGSYSPKDLMTVIHEQLK